MRPCLHAALLAFLLAAGGLLVATCGGCSSSEQKKEFQPGPLTVEELRRTEYINQFVGSGKAPLDTGVYRERLPESLAETVVRLSDLVAFGTVNGKDAAAAVLVTAPAGYGAFNELALVIKDSTRVRNTSTQFVGDRVRIDTVVFRGDSIRIDMLVHRREDPICCPTLKVTRYFLVRGDTLVAPTDMLQARTERE